MANGRKKGYAKAGDETKAAIFVNAFGLLPATTHVLLDFGYVAPSYFKGHEDENVHVARICMDWEMAKGICDTLSKSIKENRREEKKEAKSEKTKGEK